MPFVPNIAPAPPGGEILASMNAGNVFSRGRLQNQMQALKNQMYVPMMQNQMQYKNALMSKIPAEIQRITEMNQFYPQIAQSQIGYRNALTGQIPIRNELMGQQINKLSEFNQAYPQLLQSQINMAKARAYWLMLGGVGSGMGGAGQHLMMALRAQLAQDHPEWMQNPQMLNAASNAYLSGQDRVGPEFGNMQLPPLGGQASTYVNMITKNENTAQRLNAINAADTIESIFSNADNLMPSASKYAGLLGNAKGSMDRLGSSLGQNSPDYKNFLTFINQDLPLLKTAMLRTEMAGATQGNKELVEKVANPITWYTNPKLAMQMYQSLKQLYRENIDKVLSTGSGQQINDLKNSGNSNSQSVPAASSNDPLGIL